MNVVYHILILCMEFKVIMQLQENLQNFSFTKQGRVKLNPKIRPPKINKTVRKELGDGLTILIWKQV